MNLTTIIVIGLALIGVVVLYWLIAVGVEAIKRFVILAAGGYQVSFFKLYMAMLSASLTPNGRSLDIDEIERKR